MNFHSIRTIVTSVKSKGTLYVYSYHQRSITDKIVNVPTVFEPLPKKRNGQNVMSYIHEKLLKKYDPTGKRSSLVSASGIRSGDIIKVTYKNRTNVLGQVLAIKRGVRNVGTNILIRNKFNGLGVEVRIPLYNPNIRNIEVMYKPEKYMPRSKHFYIRNTKYDVGDIEKFLNDQKEKKNA